MQSPVRLSQKAVLLIAFVALTVLSAQAQTPTPSPIATPPMSDVFVLEVGSKQNKETKQLEPKFSEPKKITDYAGYNNQPFFLPDGHNILYTSIRNGQADIYRYDLKTGATTQVTNTPESEYSPTLMPDGKNISVVRVEKDGTQRLWKFPLAGGGAPSLILENVKPVGYHHWIDNHTVALFVLGSPGKPNTLQIADTNTGKSEIVAENPGRVLRKVPERNQFSFVHKISDQHWEIKYFDMRSHTIASFVETLPGVEDYAWLNGALLMGKDSKLYAVRPFAGQKWTEVGDFSKAGIKRITRIAVSGNRIAIVAVLQNREL
jgi:dipeptidyl aminopeptidase/acylaminoacyl peptidase